MAEKPPEHKVGHEPCTSAICHELNKLNLDSSYVFNQSVPLWLRNCESPFLWHPELETDGCKEYIIKRLLQKLEDFNFFDSEFFLRRYTILLRLIVEYSFLKNEDKADECLSMMKNLINKDLNAKTPEYEKMELVLNNILYATESHLLSLKGLQEQSKEIAMKIIPMKQMPKSTQAGHFGMKASFFLYSFYLNSEEVALDYARKAVAMDPDAHEWLYLLSVALRANRKKILSNDEIPEEELALLEKAVKNCKSIDYLLNLAQVYRDFASQVWKLYRGDSSFYSSELFKTTQEMNEKALDYYKEVLKMDPDNPIILKRIGCGLMNLPKNIADYDLAIKCLLKSASLYPTIGTFHIIGTFYHRYGNDNKKALEYYEKVDNEGARSGLSSMIRVKYIEDPNYNPCEDIERGLKEAKDKKKLLFFLTQLCGYHMFIKRDFMKCIEVFNKAIQEDKDSLEMTNFRSMFLRMYETINLYQYLANEAMLYIKENNSPANEGDNHVYEVKAFLDNITVIHAEVSNIEPDPSLITKLCQQSEEIKHKERLNKHHRKHNFGYGYGGYQRGGRSFTREEKGNNEGRRLEQSRDGQDTPNRGRDKYRDDQDIPNRRRDNYRDDQDTPNRGRDKYRDDQDRPNRGRNKYRDDQDRPNRGRNKYYRTRGAQNRSKADTDNNWRRKE